MHSLQLFRLAIVVAFLILTGNIYAQDNTPIWKKRVTRVVSIAVQDDTSKHHFRQECNDTTLLELLVNDIHAGKLTAYRGTDYTLTDKVGIQTPVLTEGARSDIDAELDINIFRVAEDAITGDIIKRVVHPKFDYETVTSYRVMEEWTHSRKTGKTEVQIIAIAPMRPMYNEDWSFRAYKLLFWVRYADIQPMLARYDAQKNIAAQPELGFTRMLWDDYFADERPVSIK